MRAAIRRSIRGSLGFVIAGLGFAGSAVADEVSAPYFEGTATATCTGPGGRAAGVVPWTFEYRLVPFPFDGGFTVHELGAPGLSHNVEQNFARFEARLTVGAAPGIAATSLTFESAFVDGFIIGDRVRAGRGLRVGSGATLGEDVTLGDDVHVGDGVRIHRGAQIESGASIGDGAVVGRGARVPAGAVVPEGAVVR